MKRKVKLTKRVALPKAPVTSLKAAKKRQDTSVAIESTPKETPVFIIDRSPTGLKRPSPTKIPITSDKDEMIGLFDRIREKHNAHYSVSISRDGQCRLQIHGNPQLSYKAENLLSLLRQAAHG